VGLQKRRQLGLPKHRPALPLFVSIRVVRGSNDFVIHDFGAPAPPTKPMK